MRHKLSQNIVSIGFSAVQCSGCVQCPVIVTLWAGGGGVYIRVSRSGDNYPGSGHANIENIITGNIMEQGDTEAQQLNHPTSAGITRLAGQTCHQLLDPTSTAPAHGRQVTTGYHYSVPHIKYINGRIISLPNLTSLFREGAYYHLLLV